MHCSASHTAVRTSVGRHEAAVSTQASFACLANMPQQGVPAAALLWKRVVGASRLGASVCGWCWALLFCACSLQPRFANPDRIHCCMWLSCPVHSTPRTLMRHLLYVIVQENHALYQRLVAIRPSKDISRDTLDAEYRQNEVYRTNCAQFKTTGKAATAGRAAH